MQKREKVIKGHIEGYWEQGWEGRIEYVFIPEGGNDREEMEAVIFLSKGHCLTIYEKEGEVLWRGEIELVGRSWWERLKGSKHNVWSESKQKGVSYEEWVDWFWQKAPLKAELRLME